MADARAEIESGATIAAVGETAFGETAVAGAGARLDVAALEALGQAITPRTTILPRIVMTGDIPTLHLSTRTRYETERSIGRGGMGEVFAAADNDIGRRVALKRLNSGRVGATDLARFVEEIRTVGKLEHPNIVPIHDVGADGPGEYYFVMKHVEGETLEHIIERLDLGDPAYHARFGFEVRMQIFRGILEAVAYAHSRGVIHRDIKPANVMIGAYGEVLLMDWGVAKMIGAPDHPSVADADSPKERARAFETQRGALVGSPAYMSPEQARGETLDERSDTYSLSVLLHELLFLKHYLADKKSFVEVLDGVETDPVAPSHAKHPKQLHVPPELYWYVRKGALKDKAARFQSVVEMVDRLDRRAQGDFPIQCRLTCSKRALGVAVKVIDHHPLMATLGLVLLALSLVGIVALVVLAVR